MRKSNCCDLLVFLEIVGRKLYWSMMNDGHGSSSGLPPFIVKTYEMVDDPLTDMIVSWSQTNKSFVVWSPREFAGELLPRFFKHNNFSSFIRQLNTYGFRKIDPELWEFANEDFIRGQPHLLKNIHRKKPVHSHSVQNLANNGASSSSSLTESDKIRYIETINRLQYEKETLSLEFQGHQQEQERLEQEARALTDRLKRAGKLQKDILCCLDEFLQKPRHEFEFTPELVQTNDRKRRMSVSPETSTNQVCPFNIPVRETISADALLVLDTELVEQLESSLTLWEGILKDVDDTFEKQRWSLELDHESVSCPDSPTITYPLEDINMGSKESKIDMNSEPDNAVATKETSVNLNVNDVFWEQFLTENPGGSTTNSVEEVAQADVKEVDGRKFWWNMRSVNNLADQLGQLTPAETT